MFADRQDAGHQLARLLKLSPLRDPLVLAIPRGGLEVGAALARDLGAELDVVLARKLRSPIQPELALGAISEDGQVYMDPASHRHAADEDYLRQEREYQLREIERRAGLFRSARPAAPISGRSVIVTDDGIATGSTLIAALRTVRPRNPHELIVAVPVSSPDRLDPIRPLCDRLVCLITPELFWSLGQFYRRFGQLSDERAVALLREFAHNPAAARAGTNHDLEPAPTPS